ncbi:extracellular solute-binding protein [Paenibacillus sp. IITD108]|uniref:extracellular solute-binding protein n=1 Tax=Paenibacillus sp. IITD108 TaxID=3116649 RepID=UPI002F42D8B9
MLKMVSKSKKTVSKMIVLLLATVIMLSACSSAGNTNTPSIGGEPTSSATQNAGKEESKEPVRLSILTTHTNSEYPMKMKVADDPFIKELSKLSGYDLQYEFLGHAADFDQQLTVRFASGNLADLVRTPSIEHASHPGAVEEGIFTELGPLLEQYGPNILANIPQEAWDSPLVSKDGKIYAIPMTTGLPASKVIYVRQDWLDKLKMEQPKTIDDYLAFFEAVKVNDMNGDGNPNDEYGYYVRENLSYADLFFQEFGVSPHAWHVVDGQMIPDIIRPEMKDAIAFWKMLYDEGYVNPNLFTNSGADWSAGIVQGKAGVWVHEIANYSLGWSPGVYVNQPDAKVDVLAPPTGPKGQGGLSLRTNGVGHVWVIPASSKNAVEAIKFLNWAWSEEADNFFAYGVEGFSYEVKDNKVNWNQAVSVGDLKVNPSFYQRIINVRGTGAMHDNVIEMSPDKDILRKGIKIAEEAIIEHDSLNMPALEAFSTNPELRPGDGWTSGGLFLDMFAKVVTGREELDPAFDHFVTEWKRRGGDAAIAEATEWYNSKK